MTTGQTRAARELKRLQAADPDAFEMTAEPEQVGKSLIATVSLRIGPIQTRQGGLELREREEFTVRIPEDFPFDYPSILVNHNRFAGFPHVVWSKWICLYQSQLEWNPADGLYGFFDRLRQWLGKAAINDMDPVEGPLEPPHHVTDFSQVPFLIRANAPVGAGESWFGLAELEKHSNRIELVGWNDLSKTWPPNSRLALAVVLPEPLPLEFPQKGRDFFAELSKQGVDKYRIIKNLALAALLSPAQEPIHLVLGIPMRRSPDGSPRIHVAVWTTDATFRDSLLHVLPQNTDTTAISALRNEIADKIFTIFEGTQIAWCRVMEDRDEIVVRRDSGTALAKLKGQRILILGCGALGSWLGEMIARSNPQLLHVVDNSIVKPGLLARQNYRMEDVGANKAEALATRLRAVSPTSSIESFVRDAHSFLFESPNRVASYDVILDATASAVFQMKLERDWPMLDRGTPRFISMVIDAKAKHCLTVALGKDSQFGPWGAFVPLKHHLCLAATNREIIAAFYSERALKDLFQPEPGCSDPTFLGSSADVCALAATALNLSLTRSGESNASSGIAFTMPSSRARPQSPTFLSLPAADAAQAGQHRIRIQRSVYRSAKAWVRENGRIRSPENETGGLLWGCWDEAVGIIWIFDLSGPPPDSIHDPGHFVCGVQGTIEEHRRRFQQSHGACGFVGFWHTHPGMPSNQSGIDIAGMAGLVSSAGHNQKRSVMLIFGRNQGGPTASVYVYESQSLSAANELIAVGHAQIELEVPVV